MAPRRKQFAPRTWSDATAAPAPSASSSASDCKAKEISESCAKRFSAATISTSASPWARDATTTSPKDRYSRSSFFKTAPATGPCTPAASSDAEMAEIFKKSLAMPIDFEMLSVNEWTQHLLCAERYGEGRVFVAGDAAHLVIPTGGLGMNTGVGDAVDLSWKLAATLAGWGGPQLLASYEAERRPIGLRNVKASRAAMTGRLGWRAAYRPNIRDNTPEGAATRAEMAALFDVQQRKVTEILGIEAGYRYVDSPIVWREPGDGPDPDNPSYIPTTWPGARLPHVWLSDGTALHDRLGPGYTLASARRNARRYFEPGAILSRNPRAARCTRCSRREAARYLSIRFASREARFARSLARQ